MRHHRHSLILLLCLWMTRSVYLFGQDPWRAGEKLTYSVKWSFIRLGTLRMSLEDTTWTNGESVYLARITADSDPRLTIFSHNSLNETCFTKDCRPLLFRCNETENGKAYHAEYRFSQSDSLIYVDLFDEDTSPQQLNKTIPLEDQLYDGATLLYLIRRWSLSTGIDTVRHIDDGNIERIILDVQGPRGSVRSKELGGKIDVVFMEGRLLSKGMAGLTGQFKIWLSGDDRRVPLRAEVRMLIGTVTLNLESWEGWEPAG